jgi:hypothetical protein
VFLLSRLAIVLSSPPRSSVAAEAQLTSSGNSVTVGLSVGVGAEVSVGTRDSDHDAQTEFCARIALGPVMAGVCVEPTLMNRAY